MANNITVHIHYTYPLRCLHLSLIPKLLSLFKDPSFGYASRPLTPMSITPINQLRRNASAEFYLGHPRSLFAHRHKHIGQQVSPLTPLFRRSNEADNKVVAKEISYVSEQPLSDEMQMWMKAIWAIPENVIIEMERTYLARSRPLPLDPDTLEAIKRLYAPPQAAGRNATRAMGDGPQSVANDAQSTKTVQSKNIQNLVIEELGVEEEAPEVQDYQGQVVFNEAQ
ncbi:hypothetical protein DFH27DRAFT_524217 [Peziza echinospora]|nr:hypothetical protein DFH27DRAFT_524217 [Peziza echinospora]